jgi:ATP-binding cassette subfamily B multidrug efflux pump
MSGDQEASGKIEVVDSTSNNDPAVKDIDEKRALREAKIIDLLADDEEDLLGQAYDSRLVKRLLNYTYPYRTRLVAAIILMVITSLLSVSGPWIIGKAIDEGIVAGDLDQLRRWSIIFIVAALGEWLANRSRISIMAYVGTKVVANIRSDLYRHLHRLSLNFYNRYSVGRLMSRLIIDLSVLQDFITWSITGLFRS